MFRGRDKLLNCVGAEAGEIEKASLEKIAGPVGGPPGLRGFGDVGESRVNFNRMVRGMTRLQEISENVMGDQLNTERYVQELTDVVREMFMASGSMFEQEHLRFINMFAAAGVGGKGGGNFFDIMSSFMFDVCSDISSFEITSSLSLWDGNMC